MPKHVKCKMSELLLVCLFFFKVKKQADLEKDEGTRVFFLKVEKQADLFFFRSNKAQ